MDVIDFSRVLPRHDLIHAQLEQWARWVRVRPATWATHPMWREYRSNAWQWERPEVSRPINTLEAHRTEVAVSKLPDKHRMAIRWFYVYCTGPTGMARQLAVSKQGLAELVDQGRDMLINRGAVQKTVVRREIV